jgi:integrase
MELGTAEATAFLDYLAGPGGLSLWQTAEAGRALHFFYSVVLEKPLAGLVLPAGLPDPPPAVTAAPAAPRLLEQMRHVLRVRHYSRRTEDCYVDWARRFILFHHKRHPRDMGTAEVARFLTHLAVEGNVAVSTQMQALNALVFLYRHLLENDLGRLDHVRATRPARLPIVLSRIEVRRLLEGVEGFGGLFRVMAELLDELNPDEIEAALAATKALGPAPERATV